MTKEEIKKEIEKVYEVLAMSNTEWKEILDKNYGKNKIICEVTEQRVEHVLAMLKNIINDKKNDFIKW